MPAQAGIHALIVPVRPDQHDLCGDIFGADGSNAALRWFGNSIACILAHMTKAYCVYILASGRNGTLYIGATSDLIKRVHQHKTGAVEGFTLRYGVDRLVWFEQHESTRAMVTRERQLKEWKRAWKVELIESVNPDWRDLYGDILGDA